MASKLEHSYSVQLQPIKVANLALTLETSSNCSDTSDDRGDQPKAGDATKEDIENDDGNSCVTDGRWWWHWDRVTDTTSATFPPISQATGCQAKPEVTTIPRQYRQHESPGAWKVGQICEGLWCLGHSQRITEEEQLCCQQQPAEEHQTQRQCLWAFHQKTIRSIRSTTQWEWPALSVPLWVKGRKRIQVQSDMEDQIAKRCWCSAVQCRCCGIHWQAATETGDPWKCQEDDPTVHAYCHQNTRPDQVGTWRQQTTGCVWTPGSGWQLQCATWPETGTKPKAYGQQTKPWRRAQTMLQVSSSTFCQWYKATHMCKLCTRWRESHRWWFSIKSSSWETTVTFRWSTDGRSPTSVLGVDRTFNLGKCFVTLMVYKHKLLWRKGQDYAPIKLGPLFLHWDGDFRTYHTFFAHLQGRLGTTLSSAEVEMNDEMFIGSDKEKVLNMAIKTCFPNAMMMLCTKHLEDNLHSFMHDKVGCTNKETNTMAHRVFGTHGLVSKSGYQYHEAKEYIFDTLQELPHARYWGFCRCLEGKSQRHSP